MLTDQQKSNVEAIMLAVIKKLTYDDEYNFESEGEDEAMFVEYRKQLKLLLDRLAQVSPELLLEAVRRVFNTAIQSWQCTAFMEVEVAIRLLYMLGEALPASHGAHFCGDIAKASALQDMMRTLVTSGVSEYRHTSVVLEFFETVVRYDKFFIVEPQHIPHVLMAFLDHRGLRHSSPKVRSRTSYLFSRFVKTLHKHMSAFIEDILSRIQDLLELSPPENGFQALLSNDDQLFIFEAAGVLIVNSEYTAERKQALMKNLLTPLMEKFTILLDKLPMEQDEGRQAALADCLNHAENGFQALLSNDDQLFIFEAAGVLIVNSEYTAERKQALMKNLLTPLMEKFTILLDKLPMEQDEGRQAALADCLNHAVGFARYSFNERNPKLDCVGMWTL
ncbi:Exportin-T [Acipenser ruthenus]|uniref:Exportin-T n=1 Tax=Acipenser ruthenus TaxID=7906 RepID=A0A662YYJ9_ACIRT|nr:Exportin-T [Acipenser ruthenus]